MNANASSEAAASTSPESTAKTATPAPTHVRASERFTTVPLEWPVEFGGTTFYSVGVRRMTVEEIEGFTDRVRNAESRGEKAPTRFPMFDIPDEVFAILDVDDADKVDEVAARFLPRRYLDAPAPAQSPAAGDA
ncbi:hypothetical protein BA190_09305 [Labrys sp. WJW]|uniref:hypothetical protein n=1 Tax=Labrys sp. WJW TaxID=1737983 RepID=UPI00082A15FF|nr:hypothetical protein [Labrys sp. WJW]OCC05102.1 hypothetical protein BA190_09305 [Labrys sp. WJW]